MDNLADLLAAGDSQVLPGYVLKPWRIEDYAEAEREFAAQHLATAGRAAAEPGIPPPVGDRLIAAATKDVRDGYFNYGRQTFDIQLTGSRNIPFMLYLCIRANDPKFTRPQVNGLLNRDNQGIVHARILDLLGIDYGQSNSQPKNADAPPPTTTPASTGGASASSSVKNENSGGTPLDGSTLNSSA